MSGPESIFSRNISGVHPRPSASPTFLQSACLTGKYWGIQENEAGPLSQCVVTVVFRGAPSIIFMTVLLLDVFRALEQPLVKAPLSFTFTTKLISIFVLFAGCFANTFCWLTLYKNEDYVVVSEESVEILQATAWLLSGLSLYLGYNRAREQSINLRMYISVECFMSLLLLFLRPKGFKDNVLNDTKRPLYYIVLLDVIRVLSNLLLAFIMGFYPRDVPEYSDIVFHFKDNLLLEADGRGVKRIVVHAVTGAPANAPILWIYVYLMAIEKVSCFPATSTQTKATISAIAPMARSSLALEHKKISSA